MWQDKEGDVYGTAQDDEEEVAGEVAGALCRTPATDARTSPGARCLLTRSGFGAHEILRCANEQQISSSVSLESRVALVEGAEISQSEKQADMDSHGPPDSKMVASSTYLPSLSAGAFWRYYLRQEPGAGKPHAGICAGGAG